MSKSEAEAAAFVFGVLWALVTFILVATLVADADEWERGWCESKGGTIVTQEVCNVDGKIVEVPSGD